jgi:hypothetical protein
VRGLGGRAGGTTRAERAARWFDVGSGHRISYSVAGYTVTVQYPRHSAHQDSSARSPLHVCTSRTLGPPGFASCFFSQFGSLFFSTRGNSKQFDCALFSQRIPGFLACFFSFLLPTTVVPQSSIFSLHVVVKVKH